MEDFDLYSKKVLNTIEDSEIKLQIEFYLRVFKKCLDTNDVVGSISANNIIKKKTGINYF